MSKQKLTDKELFDLIAKQESSGLMVGCTTHNSLLMAVLFQLLSLEWGW